MIMAKNISWALLLFIWALTSCQSSSYIISGTLPDQAADLDDQYIYLLAFGSQTPIDSAKISGGAFSFSKREAVDSLPEGVLSAGERYKAVVILEPGRILVDMSREDGATGTPLNDALSAFLARQDKALQATKAKSDSISSLMEQSLEGLSGAGDRSNELYMSLQTLLEAYHSEVLNLNRELFEANRENVLGARALNLLLGKVSKAEADHLIASAGPVVLRHPQVAALLEARRSLEATQDGQPFTDFADDSDPELKLSRYVGRGHYTLVDFWASWCAPCRREMPALRRVYDHYRDRGLRVVGVAVADKREAHAKAVAEDGISWPQIFSEQEASRLYGIETIPHFILFAPDGTIVERDLRGDRISRLLDDLLEKNGGRL